jgi:hypothetical protein
LKIFSEIEAYLEEQQSKFAKSEETHSSSDLKYMSLRFISVWDIKADIYVIMGLYHHAHFYYEKSLYLYS